MHDTQQKRPNLSKLEEAQIPSLEDDAKRRREAKTSPHPQPTMQPQENEITETHSANATKSEARVGG